jgi:hypothetical protein
MNTVRILDHYRLSLYDDPLVTLALAIILRNGGTDEASLEEELQRDSATTKSVLNRLFSANYATLKEGSRWIATDFGIYAATRVGLVKTIAEDEVGRLGLPKHDYRFVYYCINSADAHESDIVRVRLLSNIRLWQEKGNLSAKEKEFARRATYATIVGLDPRNSAGEGEFLRYVISRAREREGSTFNRVAPDIEVACKRALLDVKLSNRLFIHGSEEKASTYTKYFSALRIYSAAQTRRRDFALHSVFHLVPASTIASNLLPIADVFSKILEAFKLVRKRTARELSFGDVLSWVDSEPADFPVSFGRTPERAQVPPADSRIRSDIALVEKRLARVVEYLQADKKLVDAIDMEALTRVAKRADDIRALASSKRADAKKKGDA